MALLVQLQRVYSNCKEFLLFLDYSRLSPTCIALILHYLCLNTYFTSISFCIYGKGNKNSFVALKDTTFNIWRAILFQKPPKICHFP